MLSQFVPRTAGIPLCQAWDNKKMDKSPKNPKPHWLSAPCCSGPLPTGPSSPGGCGAQAGRAGLGSLPSNAHTHTLGWAWLGSTWICVLPGDGKGQALVEKGQILQCWTLATSLPLAAVRKLEWYPKGNKPWILFLWVIWSKPTSPTQSCTSFRVSSADSGFYPNGVWVISTRI